MKKQILIGLLVALSMQSVVVARYGSRSLYTKNGLQMDQQLLLTSIDRTLAVVGTGLVASATIFTGAGVEAVPYAALVAAIIGRVGYEAHKKFTPLYETFKKAQSDYKEQCIREPETGVCVKVGCQCKSGTSVINEKNLIQPNCPSRYNEDGRPLVFGQK
jgi:hypothetical protein